MLLLKYRYFQLIFYSEFPITQCNQTHCLKALSLSASSFQRIYVTSLSHCATANNRAPVCAVARPQSVAFTTLKNYFICFGNFANECAFPCALCTHTQMLSGTNWRWSLFYGQQAACGRAAEDRVLWLAAASAVRRRAFHTCVKSNNFHQKSRNYYKWIFTNSFSVFTKPAKAFPQQQNQYRCASCSHCMQSGCVEGCVDFPAFWRRAPFVYFFEMRTNKWSGILSFQHASSVELPILRPGAQFLIVQTSRLHSTLFACSRRVAFHRSGWRARTRVWNCARAWPWELGAFSPPAYCYCWSVVSIVCDGQKSFQQH